MKSFSLAVILLLFILRKRVQLICIAIYLHVFFFLSLLNFISVHSRHSLLTRSSCEPSRALDSLQTSKEWTRVSTLIDFQASDTQLMASCRVDCFKFPALVSALSSCILACQLALIDSLKGLLIHLSIG